MMMVDKSRWSCGAGLWALNVKLARRLSFLTEHARIAVPVIVFGLTHVVIGGRVAGDRGLNVSFVILAQALRDGRSAVHQLRDAVGRLCPNDPKGRASPATSSGAVRCADGSVSWPAGRTSCGVGFAAAGELRRGTAGGGPGPDHGDVVRLRLGVQGGHRGLDVLLPHAGEQRAGIWPRPTPSSATCSKPTPPHRCSSWALLRLPAAMPFVLNGLKVCTPLAH